MSLRTCIRFGAASIGLLCLAVAAADAERASPYPDSRRTAVVDTWHGTRVADPYRWLEATDSAEVRNWVAAQNRHSRAVLRDDPRRKAIRARIEALGGAFPTDEMPVQAGDYLYVMHTDPATGSRELKVSKGPRGERKPALDLAELPPGYEVKTFVPSPDGTHVAYTVGAGGTDWGEIRIRNVAAARNLPEVLRNVRFGGVVAWTADGAGFLYRRHAAPASSRHDAPATGAAIHRHRLGTPMSADRQLYALPTELADWSPTFRLSDDRRRLYLHVERGPWLDFLGGSRQRVSTIALDETGLPGEADDFVALTRLEAAYRVIYTEGTRIYLMTDLAAPRRRLVEIDLRDPAPGQWRTIIAESAAVMDSVHRFGDRFVASYLVDVHSELRSFDAQGTRLAAIALPGPGVVRELSGDARTPSFRFIYTSLLQPPVVMQHDLRDGTTRIEIKGNLAPDLRDFETRQLWFASKDRTRVPMYVVARRDLVRDGSHPTILHGYGASGTSFLPEFSEDVIAWLELGGVYAVANVRGGGEFGRAWYEAAIRERKQTSFDDFIAAAEHLIAEGYTAPRKLAIRGASNGGLLVTASMIQRPELYGAVLADVPVTDMLRRARSGTGAIQTDQWGTPQEPQQFKAMYAYSPLHNVVRGRCYPPTLITTAANDDRLPPWHAYKLAAMLQYAQSCDRPILLHVRDSGGHGGSGDADAWFDEAADQLAFAARELDLAVGAAGAGVDYTSDGRLPLPALMERFDALASRHGWQVETIYAYPGAGNPEIKAWHTPHRGEALWILSGIHGEEPAGPNAIANKVAIIAELAASGVPMVVIPLANPKAYRHNWRYPNTPERDWKKGGYSVGDAEYLLPDLEQGGAPRAAAASGPETAALTQFVLRMAEQYPPSLVLDLHEDELSTAGGYIYSQGTQPQDNPVGAEVVRLLQATGIPLRQSGKTRFGEPVVKGVISHDEAGAPIRDGSIDELLAATEVFLDGRKHAGPAARTVIVVETPAFEGSQLDLRVAAQSAVLQRLRELWQLNSDVKGNSGNQDTRGTRGN